MSIALPCLPTQESSTPLAALGTKYRDDATGKEYMYVKANEALAYGAAVTPMYSKEAGTCAASTGKQLVDTAKTFTTALVGCYVKIVTGTASITDEPNEVLALTSTTELKLKNAWSVALTTAEGYVIYNPFLVEETDAAGERVVGVVPVTAGVTSGYYFLLQIRGYCSAVKVTGVTDSILIHKGIVSSSTAGVLKGLTETGGTTADEAEKTCCISLVTTDLVQTIPAYLNCRV